jgi:hypothetical protein
MPGASVTGWPVVTSKPRMSALPLNPLELLLNVDCSYAMKRLPKIAGWLSPMPVPRSSSGFRGDCTPPKLGSKPETMPSGIPGPRRSCSSLNAISGRSPVPIAGLCSALWRSWRSIWVPGDRFCAPLTSNTVSRAAGGPPPEVAPWISQRASLLSDGVIFVRSAIASAVGCTRAPLCISTTMICL